MMMRKLTVAALFILVATATAHPYAEWSNARYRWNAARGQDVGARVKSQASVELSSCALVTHTETTTDGKSHDHRVRICSADPEDSPNNVCLVTRVNPCCRSNCSLDNLVSSAQVSVAGEVITVAYYLTRWDQAARICFRLDDAHQMAKTCSQPVHENGSCLPPCLIIRRINDTCFNNTLTGDSSSCNGDTCRCKTGYLPPDCCQCDTNNFYLPDCRPFCRRNCRLFRPANLGGCLTCGAGFTGAPECCQCEPGKTEVNGVCKCDANLRPDGNCAEGALESDCCECDTTGNAIHAFYKTASGECIPFCKSNCAVIGSSGCTTCKTGFMTEPECCQCEPGHTEVNGVCKCDINLKPNGTCAEGALEPDCCECDTAGKATHAFYKTPSGECKSYCDNNCAGSVGFGCSTCKAGFMSPPECCQCVPGRDEVAGVCKCRANLKLDGTCAEGALEPDCCECDTIGSATHAFYKNEDDECIPFCKSNCAVIGSSGCATCKDGFMREPECCQCEPGRTEVNGVCKCRANLKPDGTCAEGTLESDCCECDTIGSATHAFYKNEDEECIPFCQSNCAAIGVRGCLSCKTGFEAVPECCQCEPDREEVNGICKCSANLRPDGSCIPEAKPEDCCECITGYQRNPTTGRCEQENGTCHPPQNLFFYIDATTSNTFENFCPLIIVLQMIVAAFSPSSSSGIQIGSLLFSDNAKEREPSQVFETDTSCHNAVQGEDHSLLSLMEEFGICLDEHRKYNSIKFPSMCGEGTSAVWGLEKIRDIARTKSAHKSTVLMITDGIIEDDKEKRTTVLSDLESAGVTIIEAGYGDADLSTMKLYTDRDNIMIDDDPVELGKAIVNKLKVKGILCDKYAKNVIESLERAQVNNLSLFCRCHRMENKYHPLCRKKKYPVCGGDLSVGLNPTAMSETLDFQESDLEEEILAAIENVLERFNGH